MINYYDILGLNRNAGPAEIKAAFRRLAKQYHPDKNPNGKEYFEKALQAYEVLSRPHLKRSYDHKLTQYQTGQKVAPQKNTGGKNWKFDEKELKRRQYYNDHIRKYAKATAAYNQQADNRKTYNEYKYILYATPLAVALFLLIMKLAGPASYPVGKGEAPANASGISSSEGLKPGDTPYQKVFGAAVYDTIMNHTLIVKNRSAADAIVCAFAGNRFIRCFFIPDNFSAEVSRLPATPILLKYSSGTGFSFSENADIAGVEGLFSRNLRFYTATAPLSTDSLKELVILPGLNEGFMMTDARGFFKQP